MSINITKTRQFLQQTYLYYNKSKQITKGGMKSNSLIEVTSHLIKLYLYITMAQSSKKTRLISMSTNDSRSSVNIKLS